PQSSGACSALALLPRELRSPGGSRSRSQGRGAHRSRENGVRVSPHQLGQSSGQLVRGLTKRRQQLGRSLFPLLRLRIPHLPYVLRTCARIRPLQQTPRALESHMRLAGALDLFPKRLVCPLQLAQLQCERSAIQGIERLRELLLERQ